MNYREIISKNVRLYRKEAGLNQAQLAEKLGVTKAAVSNWEKGVNGIDTDTLFKMSEILGVSVSQLGGIENEIIQIDLENPDINSGYKRLLAYYRLLKQAEKDNLLDYAKFLYLKEDNKLNEDSNNENA